MNLIAIFARWIDNQSVQRRSPQKSSGTTTGGSDLTSTAGNVVTSVVDTVVQPTQQPTDNSPQPTPTPTQTKDQQPPSQPTTQQDPQPQPSDSPKTTQAPTTKGGNTKGPQTVSDITTTVPAPVPTGGSAPSDSIPGAVSSVTGVVPVPSSSSPTSTAISSGGGGGGTHTKDIVTAVGAVVGVAGGFALIVIGIFIWRRHQRRKNGLDDDNDFITELSPPPRRPLTRDLGSPEPMYEHEEEAYSPVSPPGEGYYQEVTEHKEILAPATAHTIDTRASSIYDHPGHESYDASAPPLPNNGAIPTYSSMNKYAAYQPYNPYGNNAAPLASTNPVSGYRGVAVADSGYDSYNSNSYSNVNANSYNSNMAGTRGGGYRAYDSAGYV